MVRYANGRADGLFVKQVLSPETFDVLKPLVNWVERGTAPERIVATKYKGDNPANGVATMRPLCVYPARGTYNGKGDLNEAAGSAPRATTAGSSNTGERAAGGRTVRAGTPALTSSRSASSLLVGPWRGMRKSSSAPCVATSVSARGRRCRGSLQEARPPAETAVPSAAGAG